MNITVLKRCCVMLCRRNSQHSSEIVNFTRLCWVSCHWTVILKITPFESNPTLFWNARFGVLSIISENSQLLGYDTVFWVFWVIVVLSSSGVALLGHFDPWRWRHSVCIARNHSPSSTVSYFRRCELFVFSCLYLKFLTVQLICLLPAITCILH